jgi:hypothetical protein
MKIIKNERLKRKKREHVVIKAKRSNLTNGSLHFPSERFKNPINPCQMHCNETKIIHPSEYLSNEVMYETVGRLRFVTHLKVTLERKK